MARPDLDPLLLLTRPQAQSEDFLDLCRRGGFDGAALISPVVEILPVAPMPALPPGMLIFTSGNGVRALGPGQPLDGRRAWAVGGATAAAVRAAGAECRVAGGDAKALVAQILAGPDDGPYLHLRGRHARGDVAAQLRAAGRRADEAVVYDQQERPLSAPALAALRGADPVVLPLFSPRSAALVAAAAGQIRAPLHVVALSAAVAAAWNGDAGVEIAAAPDAGSMARAVLRRLGA